MPSERTPRYGLRRLLAALSVGVILLVGIGVPMAIVAPVPRASAEVSAEIQRDTTAAKAVFPDFGSSAIGAVGVDGVLAKNGPQTPRQMASITKVVTALVVLEAKPLAAGQDGPTITFGQRDVDILSSVVAANGSWEPVQVGWKVSERAAIETMLIPSANNYAESLAIWAYGSVPKYLVAARAFLRANGLDDGIAIADTNGLSAADRATPSALVALGELALQNPVIAVAVSKRTATEPNVGELENTNLLLGKYGIDGLKTGTYETGANLLFSAKVTVGTRTVQLVGVILGAKDHPTLDAHVPALLKSVRTSLHDLPLATKGQAFGTYRTSWGGIGRAVAAKDVSRLVWGRVALQRSAHIDPITGGPKGKRVGTVQYLVNGKPVTIPLVLDRDVLAAPVWWRLTHPLR